MTPRETATIAPPAPLPALDTSTNPTAILPPIDPVDAAEHALQDINAAIERAAPVFDGLTREQRDAARKRVPPHARLLAAEEAALADGRCEGRAECLRIAREHLARFTPSAYAYGPLADLIADLEALR
jgi:hypothetical protein